MLEWMLDEQRTEIAALLDDVNEEQAREGSRRIAAGHHLDEEFPWRRGPVTLRFIYLHMIEELARHAGHGDILREQIFAADAGTN
jgi:hypothetical protein